MGRGCCFGCLAVVIVVLLGLFALGYYLGKLDILIASPPAATISHVGGRPAVLAHVNPNFPAVLNVFSEGMSMVPGYVISMCLPYEGTLSIEPNPEGGFSNIALALSLRRFAGLFVSRSDPSLWSWTPAQRVTNIQKEREGLLVVRSSAPISDTALGEVALGWAQGDSEVPAIEGGHFAEVVIDNRGGRAYLALEGLIAPDAAEYGPNALGIDSRQLASVLRRIETARLVSDFTSMDALQIIVTVDCPDEIAAESTMFFLLAARDALFSRLLDQKLFLEGDVVREGSRLQGNFVLRGFRRSAVRGLEDLGQG